jgi:dolichol-phosphate mannosyltransferase
VEIPGVEMNDPTLAGIMNPQNGEVELTGGFRDKVGEPFQILDASTCRQEGVNVWQISPHGQSGWLMLTQSWHPDWEVFVDGVRSDLRKVGVAFNGVRIAEGVQAVRFVFSPPVWVSLSLGLGLISWILVLGSSAYLRFASCPVPWKKWWEGECLEFEEKELMGKKGSLLEKQKAVQADKAVKSLVILPTYNEAEMILTALDEVLAKAPNVEVLVVDDGSPDGTAIKVKSHPSFKKKIHIMERPGKAGLGSAYRAAFKWALEKGYDTVVEMDADLSHDPADVPRLLAALREGADVAIGSRYLNGIRILNWPQSRLWISTFGGWYARTLTGLPLTDPTSGFKAIRRRVLEGLNWDQFTSQGYGFQVELHFFAWQAGFNLQEVPIVFTERRQGDSKMSANIALEAAKRVLQLAFRRIFP